MAEGKNRSEAAGRPTLLDLLGSTADLGLAASLYGAERLLGLAGVPGTRKASGQASGQAAPDPPGDGDPSAESSPRVEHELAALSSALRDRLGPLARSLCRAGEDLRAAAPDLWRTAASPGPGNPAGALSDSTVFSALARQELRNRIQVYRQVAESREATGALFEDPASDDLVAAAEVVSRRDPHERLWSWEGLGYARTCRALERSAEPRDLLASSATLASGRPSARALRGSGVLPEEALPMLHAGMGLALAEACLRPLGPGSSATETGVALDRFVRLCRQNARADQEVGAWDSLGFVVRHQRPELLGPSLAALSRTRHAELAGFFWHGVGRAIYFLPMHFLPGLATSRQALETVTREIGLPGPAGCESSRGAARRQAMAGFGLATSLTNLRHPPILERVVDTLAGPDLSPPGDPGAGDPLWGAGFEEGVESALLIRGSLIPDPVALETLRDHRPEPRLEQAWARWVLEPAERAVARPPRVNGAGPFLALNRRLVASASARAEAS